MNAFNIDKVRETINKAKKETNQGGPSLGYLPEGDHAIRWLFDPDGEIYREVVCHQMGRLKTICPDWAAEKDPEGEHPLCEICKIAEEHDKWQWRRRFNCLVYGYVLTTKQQSEYWQADTTYVIIGNTRLKRELIDMLEKLVEDSDEYLLTMLTPTMNGPFTNVSVVKGSQGNVSITPTVSTKKVPPIEFEADEYVPLGECFIPERFDMIAYNNVLREVKGKLAEQDKEDAERALDSENLPEPESDTKKNPLTEMSAEDIINDVSSQVSEVVEEVAPSKPVEKQPESKSTEVEAPDPSELPEDCPGWAKYSPSQPACVTCDFNLACMKAAN